jgi:ArsR family metal-binding transcriptional regulator
MGFFEGGSSMLRSGYTKKIFRPECNPSFQSVHCIARLNENVGEVLPYLNAVLGGDQYFQDPPEVMFLYHGKIIKVGARDIAINALKDEQEADCILEWIKNEINQAWENRSAISPCCTGKTKPGLMEVLRLLPKSNCKKCGLPTCMVFATQVVDGGRGAEHCPELSDHNRTKLSEYLAGFDFD